MSSASNSDQPQQKYDHPLPLSLLSLPEEIVLSCLARIPRSYYLNLSLVSKTLRSLVRSPELNRLRSLLHNKSLYIGFCKGDEARTYHWLTLCPIEKTVTTIEYRLVPIHYPSHPFMYYFLSVSIGSEFYFITKLFQYPSDLWILDTRSGKLTQGPSMKVKLECEDVGVIDGKIYVIGVVGFTGSDEKIQVEVFDPESKIWKSAGHEKGPPRPWFAQIVASTEGKIYMVGGRTTVYNLKEGEGERMVYMVSEKLIENNQKGKKMRCDMIYNGCVVENVIYASYEVSGLMWFDTKVNVWRRLINRDGKEVYHFRSPAMVEYDGKLAVFISEDYFDRTDNYTKKNRVQMFLIALDRVGERICGTVEWSGIVSTIPHSCIFSFR